MNDVEHPLYSAFRNYAALGEKTTTSLDSAKFMKLVKDSDLLEGRLDRRAVDLIFAKAKPKTERRMAFPDFLVGVNLVAAAKYPHTDEAVSRRLVYDRMVSAGQVVRGARPGQADAGGIFARLADARLHTGAHQHRSEEQGVGMGALKSDSATKGVGSDSAAKGAGSTPALHRGDSSHATRADVKGGGGTTAAGGRPVGTRAGPGAPSVTTTTSSHGSRRK